MGTVPDVGAWRAAEFLGERFGTALGPERADGAVPPGEVAQTGDFKGNALYSGHDLAAFAERGDRELLERAARDGGC